MDTEGKETANSVADAAFSEMDSDNDGVVTRYVRQNQEVDTV